jgi:hypothetical protein
MFEADIGLMLTPISQRYAPTPEWVWAADNGCFSDRWEEKTWMKWLLTFDHPGKALFATVPDVVADHMQTMKRWEHYAPKVVELGFKPAFVLQDGATKELPFEEMGALFIGGTTEFKLSNKVKDIVQVAKNHNVWVHMGRVNSYKRMLIAYDFGCDSVDGTYIAFAPNLNTNKLIRMLNKLGAASMQLPLH